MVTHTAGSSTAAGQYIKNDYIYKIYIFSKHKRLPTNVDERWLQEESLILCEDPNEVSILPCLNNRP